MSWIILGTIFLLISQEQPHVNNNGQKTTVGNLQRSNFGVGAVIATPLTTKGKNIFVLIIIIGT